MLQLKIQIGKEEIKLSLLAKKKKQRLVNGLKKQQQQQQHIYICHQQQTHFRSRDINRLKVREWKKILL